MITSIELQVISKILTSENTQEVETLCNYDASYYSVFKEHAEFIFEHKAKYGDVPDVFTFQSQFPDVNLVTVKEPLTYLSREIRKNKQHIILLETFNKIKDLGSGDVTEAWQYLTRQCDRVAQLDENAPMDIIHNAKARADQVKMFAQQKRIPTGFPEIDKLMYGGLSTVEELLLIIGRTGIGKSWVLTRIAESAQKNGVNVLYYSPEMMSAYIGARFDTWRGHFQNNLLFQGKYTEQYEDYILKLQSEEASIYVVEDKDMAEGEVNISNIENLIKRYDIHVVIVDGLSYMSDVQKATTDYLKYKNICGGLFKLSKQYSCAMVVAMQANRETKMNLDDKGEAFPNLYNCEGSDHPARICTQAFALRQIFDKHVLDIRVEKARNANNQKPVLSYAWDVNTGNMQYLPGGDDDVMIGNPVAVPTAPSISTHTSASDSAVLEDEFEDDDVEF